MFQLLISSDELAAFDTVQLLTVEPNSAIPLGAQMLFSEGTSPALAI